MSTQPDSLLSTVVIFVDADPMVNSFKVTLTPSGGGAPVVRPSSIFENYTGPDPARAGDKSATVADFPATPKFTGELAIAGGGGAEAKALFQVDGVSWTPILHTTSTTRPDVKEVHP